MGTLIHDTILMRRIFYNNAVQSNYNHVSFVFSIQKVPKRINYYYGTGSDYSDVPLIGRDEKGCKMDVSSVNECRRTSMVNQVENCSLVDVDK